MPISEQSRENILFVDCFAGIAGDMFLSSLVDLSDGEDHLKAELAKLSLTGYSLEFTRGARGGISGLKLDVPFDEGHCHRHLGDIEEIINSSSLSDIVKKEAVKAFTMLAEAEAKVHGEPVDHVHFHEVGAVDAIVDITGAMIMLEYIGWPKVYFSKLNVGSGTVKCAHGTLPVPAPATLELLEGMEVYTAGDPMERVTPTGAALVRSLSGTTSANPGGTVLKIGVGLGSRDGALPNLLRSTLMRASSSLKSDRCVELCANIDDMTAEDLAFASEALSEAGALDVWFESIFMKKNRPAVKISVLCKENNADEMSELMLKHTSTFGVRRFSCDRTMFERRTDTFDSPLGEVRIKSAVEDGKVVKQSAEFDDVRRIALSKGMTLSEVRSYLASETFTPPVEVEEHCERWHEHIHEHEHEHEHIHEHSHDHSHSHSHSHIHEPSSAHRHKDGE